MTKTESPGETFPIDELLAFRDGADRHGRAPDLADIRALINKVAAPYLARIAEPEAENKALREAATPKPYRYNPGPSFGDLCDPEFVAPETAPPAQKHPKYERSWLSEQTDDKLADLYMDHVGFFDMNGMMLERENMIETLATITDDP